MVDPWYYVIQLIFFPIAGVIFGYFLNALAIEITNSGWGLSPRCVWRWCLAMSSFLFCVLELDPYSVLGILPTAWRNGVEFLVATVLLNATCSTFYMYIIVLSKRHLSKATPSLITSPNLWVGSNVLATIGNFILGLIGAITNEGIWFAIALFIVISQEWILFLVVNVTLHKMSGLLKELETHTKMNYKMQRRKLLIIRVVGSLLIVIEICFEFARPDSYIHGLTRPTDPPLGRDPEAFTIISPVLPVIIVVAHLVLLYAMQAPSDSSRPTTAIALTSSSVEQVSKSVVVV